MRSINVLLGASELWILVTIEVRLRWLSQRLDTGVSSHPLVVG